MKDHLEKAIKLAVDVHHGAVDKAGIPYVLHPLRVMLKMKTADTMIAAVLHDVIEDTDCTLKNLEEEGFPLHIITAIDKLTRKPEDPYMDYIAGIIVNPIAHAVKIADLEDNMDITRLPEITPADAARLRKYREAWNWLKPF